MKGQKNSFGCKTPANFKLETVQVQVCALAAADDSVGENIRID